MKLSPKVITLVLGVLIISMGLITVPLYWYSRNALEEELGAQLERIVRIISRNVDPELLRTLTLEPELANIRQRFEQHLEEFAVPGVEGLTLYDLTGEILAEYSTEALELAQISEALPGFLALKQDDEPVVSEIYQLNGGRYFKAAAISLENAKGTDAILVIWAGAGYMSVIEQMTGSLLWIMLGAIFIAVSLTLVFSRSLIKPVKALSDYTRSIQASINSEPVQLERLDEFGDLNRSLVEMHLEIRQQEEAARQLLSGIAHEIKNPLGGMEIYSELLQEELAGDPSDDRFTEHQQYLAKIRAELQHLKQIVEEYLDYARPLKSIIETVMISDIVKDVRLLVKPELDSLDQHLDLEGDAELQSDRSKLHRVFFNLVQNGLQASGESGSVTIKIDSEQDNIQMDFCDTGAGVPEADQKRIFEPYFSTSERGFGLGLTIVQNIVTELGGTILVHNSDETGTTFRLRLPKQIDEV